MDYIEKKVFKNFVTWYFHEYQLEVWKYEGRKAPHTLQSYYKSNRSFLLSKWKKEKFNWLNEKIYPLEEIT